MSITNTILSTGSDAASIMSTASKVTQSATKITQKIKSLTSKKYKSAEYIRDLVTHGFLKPYDSEYVPNFFTKIWDEPTYLTFRIEFITDENDSDMIKRNTMYNNAGISGKTSENCILYNTMYDCMPEPFLAPMKTAVYSLLTPDGGGTRDTSVGILYSTELYLNFNLGDHARAAFLHNFKAGLKDIETNFPYYFKSISGLSSLSQVNPKVGMRLKDAKITISCEEALDLRITQLLNLYRKIVWDDIHQKWILPDMMRYFGMRIYVSEIRMFHDYNSGNNTIVEDFFSNMRNPGERNGKKIANVWDKINGITSQVNGVANAFLGTKSHISKAMGYIQQGMGVINDVKGLINTICSDIGRCNNALNEIMPTVCYECHMCELDIENTMEHINELHSSNGQSNALSPKIVIKVGQVEEKHAYPLNASMSFDSNGYYKLVKDYVDEQELEKIKGFNDLCEYEGSSDNPAGYYLGGYIYDSILNKSYIYSNLSQRLKTYITRLINTAGSTSSLILGNQRYSKKVRGELKQLTYEEGNPQKSYNSLLATALNETIDIARTKGGNGKIWGTNSLATDPESYAIQHAKVVKDALNSDSSTYSATNQNPSITSSINGFDKQIDPQKGHKKTEEEKAQENKKHQEIRNNYISGMNSDSSAYSATNQSPELIEAIELVGDALMDAADRIYNGDELQTMNASDSVKAAIANEMFSEFIKELEQSTATENSVLNKILEAYKVVINEEKEISMATSKEKINFSSLN